MKPTAFIIPAMKARIQPLNQTQRGNFEIMSAEQDSGYETVDQLMLCMSPVFANARCIPNAAFNA